MPVFKYKGYAQDGSPSSGVIEADGKADALRLLKYKQIYPNEIMRETQHSAGFSLFRRLDAAALSKLTRQFSVLLSSGVPMVESVRTLIEQENTGHARYVLIGLKERISAGAGLSRAMEDFPDVFPEFYISMVNAGEGSGCLDTVLERLSDFLETQEQLKADVRAASVYPTVMVCVGAIVLFFIFSFVVPKLTKVFEDSATELPLITTILIQITHVFQHYWWLIGGVVMGGWLYLRRVIKSNGRYFGALLMRVPLLRALYVSRFLTTAGFLLSSGVPMLRALRLASRSIGNTFLAGHVEAAEKDVAEGISLSAALSAFPPIVRQIVSTGEKTGTLPEMLGRAARMYEDEFRLGVKKTISALEPALIIMMGLIVGFIVFAVLLPVFELNQLIK
ncbi:type II secretion system F family protein [Candidatus Magnetominusculus xianensis]|uniref:General secretion pathway protein GspF n=1 Tax=Candidatus Magnetominusculus xianensis TaxID=1748249 RepID=A0ABR5SIE2_9BACT|nr:type II secretion system F family protein [Candidatus Magnetominusculus xianensis]KWT92671.1 general secretion pathway protein GspF [Candidatus Magnetominusculus xianensis]MBF0403778.1 type II secretion system F family protein [Nitrospirota bacterium]